MSPFSRTRGARGFTLIELSLVLVVAGILLAVTVWRMDSFIVGNRVSAAAREFVVKVRNAEAIAARANKPVEVAFVHDGDGCVPRYEIRTDTHNYDTVCLGSEYPGVALSAGTLAGTDMLCADEASLIGLQPCTLCTGDPVLTIYPSGEIDTSGVHAEGDSVVFSPAADNALSRMVGVGIRNLSGRTRIYKPDAAGTGWSCP